MANVISSFLVLKAGVGERMRVARSLLGLKQADLAELGQVSRATQVSYEAGATEPNTAYLRGIQASGIDIPLVLFGHTSQEIDAKGSVQSSAIDWDRLQAAHEDVEFFCQRVAPTCPSRYRWLMVSELYSRQVKLGDTPVGVAQAKKETMGFLSSILANYV